MNVVEDSRNGRKVYRKNSAAAVMRAAAFGFASGFLAACLLGYMLAG